MPRIESTRQIVVTPSADGFRVKVDGVDCGSFADGGEAAAAWAIQREEVVRLSKVIDDHASWMHSRTPDQVNNLDCGTMRAMAQELRFLGGVNG